MTQYTVISGQDMTLSGQDTTSTHVISYAIVSGDDLMPQWADTFSTLSEAARRTTAGDYVVALVDGDPRPLSATEEEEYQRAISNSR